MPYPFYFIVSSISALLLQTAKMSWFQMIFTSFFLTSITLLPVALQNAQLKTYPLTTFVSDVFDPLSTDVMKDIQEHVVIKDQELTIRVPTLYTRLQTWTGYLRPRGKG